MATSFRFFVVAAALAAAAAAPGTAGAYGWPLKPFNAQHPVRGFFGDPRIGDYRHADVGSLHFGVDVSAPDGTAVYATTSGRVVIEAVRPEVVSIRAADGRTVFAYWHVVPAVANGTYAVAYRTVVGHIARGWGHVHFAEFRDHRYLNPLRPGAMQPYGDETNPRVHGIAFERDGRPVGRHVHGRVDIVVEPLDETPVAVPAPWNAKPVMPAFVEWRIARRGVSMPWRVAFDARTVLPTTPFRAVYARWTRQNRRDSRGRYRLLLAHGFDTSSLQPGSYRVEVRLADTRGNRGFGAARFAVVRPGSSITVKSERKESP